MSGRVLVTRPADQGDELNRALVAHGLDPIHVPAVRVEVAPANPELDLAVQHIERYAWVVATSANGARALIEAVRGGRPRAQMPRWAVLGGSTAAAVEAHGHRVVFVPSRPNAAALAAELPIASGDRVLVVRGDLAGTRAADRLRGRGAAVDDVVAYRTIEGPADSRPLLRAALEGSAPSAVVFASGSAARGLAALAAGEAFDVRSIPAVAIGPETATAARDIGFTVVAVASSPGAEAVAAATAEAVRTESEKRT